MFAQTVLEFVSYLNRKEYGITADRVAGCIASFSDNAKDCTDYDDTVSTMRFYFCTNRRQRAELPAHFGAFLERKKMSAEEKEKDAKIKEAEDAFRKTEEEYERIQREYEEKVRAQEKEAERIRADLLAGWKPEKSVLSKADLAFIKKNTELTASTGVRALDGLLNTGGAGMDLEEAERIRGILLKKAEESAKAGDISKTTAFRKLFDILGKIAKAEKLETPRRERAVKEATNGVYENIRQMNELRKKEERELHKTQKELSGYLASLHRESVIIKQESVQHRETFIYPHNAVQTYGTQNCPPEAEKEFRKLTDTDRVVIRRYIHENILKFKTDMSRNLEDRHTGNIDMCRTIRDACRTGGLPVNIRREIKKPGKANMILMLDVSGSCREASEMMLTFMFMLQEVFPRGCRAYAFVNSLFDITQVMRSKNPEDAIHGALEMIPRAGQYSNYERPITDIWENHKAEITKDSLVIIMGDGRNNKNRTAEYEFRNIARRAKKVYWLNTDRVEKWGQGDSIAPVYAKYCEMYEAETPADIVRFLNRRMR